MVVGCLGLDARKWSCVKLFVCGLLVCLVWCYICWSWLCLICLCYVIWFVRLDVVLFIVKCCLLLDCLNAIVMVDGLLLIVLICEVFDMFGFMFVMVGAVCWFVVVEWFLYLIVCCFGVWWFSCWLLFGCLGWLCCVICYLVCCLCLVIVSGCCFVRIGIVVFGLVCLWCWFSVLDCLVLLWIWCWCASLCLLVVCW